MNGGWVERLIDDELVWVKDADEYGATIERSGDAWAAEIWCYRSRNQIYFEVFRTLDEAKAGVDREFAELAGGKP